MKNFFRELNTTLSGALSPVVKWLLYICTGMFLVTIIGATFLPAFPNLLFKFFGASLQDSIFKGRVWQLVTYCFVHGSFMHLLFNMLPLYFFGQRLEYRWGSPAFARFCFILAAGAVLTHLVVTGVQYAVTGGSISAPYIVGFSGVVYGLMIACALYYPDDIVYFQFLIPIKLKYMVAVMALFTFLSSFQSANSGVAHMTHLGGLLFGYLFVKFPALFDWIPVFKPRRKRGPEYVDPRERWRR